MGAAAGPQLVDTRIVVPFGNVFSSTFESALAKNIKHYLICFNYPCAAQTFSENDLTITIDQFYVWEGPFNHLNLYVKGMCRYTKAGNEIKNYEFQKSMKEGLCVLPFFHGAFITR